MGARHLLLLLTVEVLLLLLSWHSRLSESLLLLLARKLTRLELSAVHHHPVRTKAVLERLLLLLLPAVQHLGRVGGRVVVGSGGGAGCIVHEGAFAGDGRGSGDGSSACCGAVVVCVKVRWEGK